MFKTNALDSVAGAYVDRNDGLLIPGTRLEADDRNIIQDELVKVVESSGQTLTTSGSFTTQVDIGINNYASGGAILYEDTGSANVFVLTRKSGSNFAIPHNYFDGLKASFVAGNDITGAATVQIGGSLSPVSLKSNDGAALVADEILAGDEVEVVYSSTGPVFKVVQTTQSKVYTPAIDTILKPFRINRLIEDNATGSYFLPLANSVQKGGWVLTELFDKDSDNEPKVFRSGSDNIIDKNGNDTDVLYDTGNSVGVRYQSNGVDGWEI